ncbi:MAG TPA: type 1 glutamine amidotransferase domain-containing protein [Gemmata sp.]
MSLAGKRVAVLVEQLYQEMEVWYPVYRLREAGCAVELVGPEAGKTYPSKLGYPAKATLAAKDARAADFAAVVIPGGFSPDYIRRSEPMLKLVHDALSQNKPVAAICHGPWVLCSRLFPQGETPLKGRKVTCFHSIKDDVQNAGGVYVDQEVVADGNIITSRTPEDLPAFVVALMDLMGKG